MNEIEKYVQEAIAKTNNAPQADFEGYSPNEMHYILRKPFHQESPIVLLEGPAAVYETIPIFNQVTFLLNLIKEHRELKLTQAGYLPTKVVAALYEKGFMKDYFIERRISKLYKEATVPSIHLAKILVELSPLVKKRANKLSLTKIGKEQIDQNHLLFKSIFETYTRTFNWSYFDGYSDEHIGQIGFGFTLILFHKYGSKFRDQTYYAKKYLQAFDYMAQESVLPFANNPERAYIVRTFERFLDYFGFTTYTDDQKNPKVKKTAVFNQVIKIRAHREM